MLVKKWIFLQKQAFKTCFFNLKSQPILTLITSMMIGFILTFPTFLWVLSLQTQAVITDWEKHAYFSFYISSTYPESTREDILMRLRATEHVDSIKVIKPGDSLKKLLAKDEANIVLDAGMKNPLPYVVEVHPNFEVVKNGQLMQLYTVLAKIPHLESSKNDLGWFERLSAFERFLNHFSFLLLGILLLGVTFLVSNTLRMVIHARYDEIQILKLIGASQGFILSPFLYAGAFYGLLGATVAIVSVDVIIFLMQDYFRPLAILYNYVGQIPMMSFLQVLGVVSTAIMLGWAAAWVFVRYYLNTIEPV